MPVPSPRNKILPARGNFSDLSTNVASLLDGEICYAIDQDQYYQNEGGTLVSVGANKAQGALADSAVQPGDNISTLTNDSAFVDASGAAAAAPVQSVASKTGNVTLVKADITDFSDEDYATAAQGATADTALQPGDNVSDLINDAGYITVGEVPSDLVSSVNGQTGAVDLGIGDLNDVELPPESASRTWNTCLGETTVNNDPPGSWGSFESGANTVVSVEEASEEGDLGALLQSIQVNDVILVNGIERTVVSKADFISLQGEMRLTFSGRDYLDNTAGANPLTLTSPRFLEVDPIADGDILQWVDADQKFKVVAANSIGGVQSVNTQTGDVVLDTDDISEGTTNLYSQWDNATGGINYAGGNVGIGTTAPASALNVKSPLFNTAETVAAFGNSTIADGLEIITNGNLDWGFNAKNSRNLTFRTNQTEAARITSDGKVGIGTTVPQSIFVVRGTTPRITLEPTDDTQNTRIQFALADGTVKSRITGGGSDGDAIRFSQGSSERMRVDSGGNIGIGTTVPRAKLHVYGSGQNTANITDAGDRGGFFRVSSTGTVAGAGGGILFSSSQGDGANSLGFAAIKGLLTNGSGNTTGDLAFSVRRSTTDTALSEAMRIDSSGRLLVGTTSSIGGGTLQIGNTFGSLATTAQIFASQFDSRFEFNRSNNNAIVSSEDRLGRIAFNGYDGSSFLRAASIIAEVDGTPGVDDMPGRLLFSTTASGASAPTERMRIKNDGTINFSNVAVYADNTAAKAGGLVDGDVYRTSTGDLKIVYT